MAAIYDGEWAMQEVRTQLIKIAAELVSGKWTSPYAEMMRAPRVISRGNGTCLSACSPLK